MNLWSKVLLALTAWSGTAPAAQQPDPVPPGALAGRLGAVALVLACLGSLAPCRLQAQAWSTTTVFSSQKPSAFNQQVIFTASVVGSDGHSDSPTGLVTFTSGGTTLCSGVTLVLGQATCAFSALPVGANTVTATYGGDVHFPSSSGTVTQTVKPASSITTATSSPNPSAPNQQVTFTAQVNNGGLFPPTGSVTFSYGSTTLCNAVTLSGAGTATCAYSALPVGLAAVTAAYSGDANFTPSSGTALQTVQPTTTTTLVSSANPSMSGSSVTFTATVTTSPSGTPTGTVTFWDGATTLGTGSLNASGVATYATSSLAVGQHSIQAVYVPVGFIFGSTSAVLTQTVKATLATTTTNVVSSANPAMAGSPVIFTATVTTSGSKTPTGAATFMDGSAALGTGTLNSSGTATYSTSTLAVGPHSITAAYGGDANNAGSTSSALTQTVNAITATTNLTVAPTALTFNFQIGGAAPATQSVSVGSSGGALNYTVTSLTVTGGSWLSATPASSTTPSTETVSVNTTGLTAGTYTGSITITSSGAANSPQTIPVTLVVSQTGPSLSFVPVTPCRIADTRNAAGPFGGPALAAGGTRSFVIPSSSCNIPTTALAYALNFTVVPQSQLMYLTVWPTGESQPFVSTLNSYDGRIKANAAIMAAGSGGAISVYATDGTDVIIDINGYFVADTSLSALSFFALPPCRVVDTRNSDAPLGGPYLTGGQERALPVLASSCGVPSYAVTYSLNFTVVPHSMLSYLTVWPTGESQPFVSTLNAPTGTVTANAAIVPAGSLGEISVYATNDTDLVIDINGYFAPASYASQPLWLRNIAPCRVLDTRISGATLPLTIAVAGTCSVPSAAQAYVLNATVVPQGALGFLTLWPQGTTRPWVSTLNAMDGFVTSNMAIVPSSNGLIEAYSQGTTDLVLDINGFFAP